MLLSTVVELAYIPRHLLFQYFPIHHHLLDNCLAWVHILWLKFTLYLTRGHYQTIQAVSKTTL